MKVAVTSSGILFAKQKVGVHFNTDKQNVTRLKLYKLYKQLLGYQVPMVNKDGKKQVCASSNWIYKLLNPFEQTIENSAKNVAI